MTLPSRRFGLMLALGACISFILGTLSVVPAHATITITPMFAVIEGRDRYADLNLINTSDQEQTYDIGWRFFKMAEETGEYLISDKPTTDFNIAENIVYTPRRVTLQPRESQKVRLALRLKGEPPAPGDYRAHLEFSQAKKEAPAITAPEPSDDPEKSAVKVGVGINIAFSVPVIYRVGESNATATMGDVTTHVNPESGQLMASVPITRHGDYGLMGDLSIYHTPKGGSKTLVGQVQNANIFPEVTSRTFTFPLTTKSLSSGSLEIVYKDADFKKKTIFAERTLPISE